DREALLDDAAGCAVAPRQRAREVAAAGERHAAIEGIGGIDRLQLDEAARLAVGPDGHGAHLDRVGAGGGDRREARRDLRRDRPLAAPELDIAAEHRLRVLAEPGEDGGSEGADGGDRRYPQHQAGEEDAKPFEPAAQLAAGEAERSAELGRAHAASSTRSTCPSARWMMRSQRAASARSCVISMRVVPCRARRSNMRSITLRPVSPSRLPVGSSASSSCGSMTKARASATDSSASRARVAASRRPASSRGIATFSSAFITGTRRKAWKTMPTERRRHKASASSSRAPRSAPATRTTPLVARSRPPTTIIMVDLPAPDGPTTPTLSPGATSSETPRSTLTSPAALASLRWT